MKKIDLECFSRLEIFRNKFKQALEKVKIPGSISGVSIH